MYFVEFENIVGIGADLPDAIADFEVKYSDANEGWRPDFGDYVFYKAEPIEVEKVYVVKE